MDVLKWGVFIEAMSCFRSNETVACVERVVVLLVRGVKGHEVTVTTGAGQSLVFLLFIVVPNPVDVVQTERLSATK